MIICTNLIYNNDQRRVLLGTSLYNSRVDVMMKIKYGSKTSLIQTKRYTPKISHSTLSNTMTKSVRQYLILSAMNIWNTSPTWSKKQQTHPKNSPWPITNHPTRLENTLRQVPTYISNNHPLHINHNLNEIIKIAREWRPGERLNHPYSENKSARVSNWKVKRKK